MTITKKLIDTRTYEISLNGVVIGTIDDRFGLKTPHWRASRLGMSLNGYGVPTQKQAIASLVRCHEYQFKTYPGQFN